MISITPSMIGAGHLVPSFYAMVDEVVTITGCDRETLLDDFRRVHQAYGTKAAICVAGNKNSKENLSERSS